MSTPVKAIPEGYHTVTPHLIVSNASEAIEFYKRALGAVENFRLPGPGGKLVHAELQVGNSDIMLCDEFPERCESSKSPTTLGGTPVSLHIYVENVDNAMARAVEAGAKVTMPAEDMFWGDRYGQISDPYGHRWSFATHIRDVTPDEMQAAMMQMSGKGA